LRNPRRERSAVSEIIATLLMILIVVSLGATVFAFATGGFGSFENSFVNLLSNSSNQASERIAIEQILFVNTGVTSTSGVTLFVRDVGINPSTIAAVYVQNVTASAFVAQFTASPLPVTINSGNLARFTILGFLPKHGFVYSITVASTLGNTVLLDAKYN
jgi:flagellin-like protein